MRCPSALILTLGLGLVLPAAGSAVAAPRHHHHHSARVAGVVFNHHAVHGGRYALVSNGPGTGYGFYPLPEPYRTGAHVARWRQADAVHEAVETDALTSGGFRSGFLGDDVAASGSYAGYGVFSGADGYGSPFFAGYYGPGTGADYGPFGTAYAE